MYMVSVEGKSAPRKTHKDVMSAIAEAQRVAVLEPNRIVSVLEIKYECRAETIVKDYVRECE